jgi:hypothetical protein
MPRNCDCVCHKLGYIYCGPGYCPDHDAATETAKFDSLATNPYRSQA